MKYAPGTKAQCEHCKRNITWTGTRFVDDAPHDTGWVDEGPLAPNYCPQGPDIRKPDGTLKTTKPHAPKKESIPEPKPVKRGRAKSQAARAVFG